MYRTEKIDGKLLLVTNQFEDGEPVKLGSTFQTNGTGSKWLKNLGAVKVIGEVSPDATWIREGMEFEEEDFRYYLEDKDSSTSYSVFTDFRTFSLANDDYIKLIKFRCPSSTKHFH